MLFGLSFLPLSTLLGDERTMRPEEHKTQTSKTIEVPASTPWPFVTAFGLALLFAGLVTSLAVSAVGMAVILSGVIGWFRNVFPESKVEFVELETAAPVIARSTRRVDHLLPGAAGHRVFIPVEVHPYTAGLLGGLVGGAGMAIIACLYGLGAQGSIWYPINLLAAAALPSLANAGATELRVFHFSGFVVAFFSHGFI